MVPGVSHTVVALVDRPGVLARGPALRRLHLHVRQLPHLRTIACACGTCPCPGLSVLVSYVRVFVLPVTMFMPTTMRGKNDSDKSLDLGVSRLTLLWNGACTDYCGVEEL